ncbi:MAG: prepilin-type N-terminal cleavage/methylation domain-containing protein [Verrucomicrobiota bacterium JB024]|nr:prepilin-type N-terminal cleavage/methylation domain-containing protein [Verrucomicrobiota bacterium JB024]
MKSDVSVKFLCHRRELPSLGFSLIELLVSIAVIAVLMVIIIAVSGQVVESARSSKCAGNLRQIGTAFLLYANDHNGYLPPQVGGQPEGGSTWWHASGTWYTNLLVKGGYLPDVGWISENWGNSDAGYWRCPSVPDEYLECGGGYGANYKLINWWGQGYQHGASLITLRNPGRIWLIGDAIRKTEIPTTDIMCTCPLDNPNRTDIGLPDGRHNGHCNIAFADGHVESISAESIYDGTEDVFGAGDNYGL